jgi:hypothetical protein
MKDKRQRLALNWPCSDPTFAAYVLQAAAAAAGYPYAASVGVGLPYPMMGYGPPSSNNPLMPYGPRFTPYPLPGARPPMFDGMNPSTPPIMKPDFNMMARSRIERHPYDLSPSSSVSCEKRRSDESISPPAAKKAAVEVSPNSPSVISTKTALFRPFKADPGA